MRAPLHNGPTPFPLVENAESMLDLSDLVFVDAVGSGYSQAIAPNLNRTFWNVRADAEVFRDFVMRYVLVNQRQASPKFLFGESYGTTRAALHARLLEQAGMSLHGVVLQSSVLDYSNNCGVVVSTTVRCTGYVPSYGATAAWFQRTVPNPPPGGLEPFLAEARQLAQQEYDPAVLRFLSSQVPPDAVLLTRLANVTGLGAGHWQTQLNLGPSSYRVNFMPGTLLGRYDSRVTQAGGTAQSDPSSAFINGSFVQGIASYLGTTLGYTTPSTYVTLGNAIQSWNFSHDGRTVPDVVPDLAAALTLNPRLQVLVASGMHDLATPFYTTEQDLARLGAHPNIHIRNYIGGHMTYLDDGTRVRQKADLAEFYRRVLP
jgi:carboxypeptidase C (cathepsin A)